MPVNTEWLLEQLEDVFSELTVSMLGQSPAADVRIAYNQEGAPAWDIDETVANITIKEIETPMSQQQYSQYEDVASPEYLLIRELSSTKALEVKWVIYGPNAYSWAQLINIRIKAQEFHDVLARQGIHRISKPSLPFRAPENFQGRWWKRWDLTMQFYVNVSIYDEVNAVRVVDITVVQENGRETNITVE